MTGIDRQLALQDGVIARWQATGAGMSEVDIARRLRRREWVRAHPGVYVTHNGPLHWQQRAWAGVLACWPAALDGPSAIRAHEGPGRRSVDALPISVMVDQARRIAAPEGVVVRRARRFDEQVQWNLSPPRMRYDDAVIDLADRSRTDLETIAVLADACGGRRTTAGRLRVSVEATPRLSRRTWLIAVLDDVESGVCSVLEHGFLTLVERPHGLPRGLRQAPATIGGRRLMRDVLFEGKRPSWSQIVELDGRLFHDSARARDRDMERDLDAALERQDTTRLGYGQVFDRSCQTALKLGQLFRLRGWTGRPTQCPRCAQAA